MSIEGLKGEALHKGDQISLQKETKGGGALGRSIKKAGRRAHQDFLVEEGEKKRERNVKACEKSWSTAGEGKCDRTAVVRVTPSRSWERGRGKVARGERCRER